MTERREDRQTARRPIATGISVLWGYTLLARGYRDHRFDATATWPGATYAEATDDPVKLPPVRGV